MPASYFQIQPPVVTDRAAWESIAAAPRLAPLRAAIEDECRRAPERPPVPLASDYLAARRHNDRNRVDRHWQAERATISALAARRCLLGLDQTDPDDRLLDYLWAFLTEPSWTVSAHLPGNDLPACGHPTLDLASCEMAALFAELRETLRPWMDAASGTLADSVVHEIDARILTPYADGLHVWWQDEPDRLNNWLGVCAGSILCACESLAAQGQPRPAARARALAGLRLFLEGAFTPHGECDEGLGYWVYGLSYACLGWSRLSRDELEANVDLERLRRVADYPRRIHLFGDYFYSGNDAGLRVGPPHFMLPWLAAATGIEWLARWNEQAPPGGTGELRHFGQLLPILLSPEPEPASAAVETAPAPASLLVDQQAAILRLGSGELLATLAGGDNAERHNHNDLGHFMVALDGRFIVPDLGAPRYTADFFGPRRYTYLAASSRGHNCPLIGGHEQRTGHQAAGRVLEWQPDGPTPLLRLDLTAAYPPEAGLLEWTRSLRALSGEPARVELRDRFHTSRPGESITQVIWSLEEPQPGVSGALRLGSLVCILAPPPASLAVVPESGDQHGLREFASQTLYRVEALYHTDAAGRLEVVTEFAPGVQPQRGGSQ